jgi:N utilization substance protein B
MKTADDPRHIRREKAIKALFSLGFGSKKPQSLLAQKIFVNKKKIDRIIGQAAPEWPIRQINRVDLAILRLAVFEMVVKAKEPPKVVIDEAVELAKKYGSEKSASFVNGVLGTVFTKYHAKLKKSPKKTQN